MTAARMLPRMLVCVLAVVGCAGCELYAAPVEGHFDRTVKVTGPATLDIRTGSGGIRIDTGSSDTVHVVARVRVSAWSDNDAESRVKQIEANPPIQQDGNTIRIGQVGGNPLYEHVSISYEVTVPQSTQVHSMAGSGGQEIRHVHGAVDASAGSGGIEVSDIEGEVHATAGSGGIRLKDVRGAIVARVGSGGIAVSMPGGMAFELDARAGSGGVSNTQPLTPLEATSPRRIHGLVRGGGPLVQLSAGSGGIVVE